MFLVVCGDEVLLEKRANNKKGFANKIMIPAGRNEAGESFYEAARREIWEELGLVGLDLIFLGRRFDAITDTPHKYNMQSYLVLVDSKDMVKNVEEGRGEHEWYSFADAGEVLTWSHSQLVLERAMGYLNTNPTS